MVILENTYINISNVSNLSTDTDTHEHKYKQIYIRIRKETDLLYSWIPVKLLAPLYDGCYPQYRRAHIFLTYLIQFFYCFKINFIKYD